MFKQLFALSLLCLSCVCLYGQTEKYSAPVKWERYKIGEKEVSVSFPKLPVAIQSSDMCKDEEGGQYAAYAEGIVYGLNITYKIRQKNPGSFCTPKVNFSEQNFENRTKEIKSQLKTFEETKLNLNGVEAVKIKGNLFTYWLINDFNNKRWFELWTTEENENVPSVKNFVESFKIGKNPQGIEIGKGSSRTLGDQTATAEDIPDSKETNVVKAESEHLTPLRLILKPRASYTEEARRKQAQGTIRVRVTFLASGGIGSITTVSDLPYGLTEQAIAAASKIVFVPAKKNGINYAVTKTVEYSFSIY